MKRILISCIALVLFCSIAVGKPTPISTLKLPSFFSDNMVMQQEMKVPVWGWAKPGEKVTIQFQNQKVTGTTGKDGKWKVTLAPMKVGEPSTMTIQGKAGKPIILKNILIGEVWLCSGQSNMEMPLEGWGKIDNYKEEIAAANYPNIRLYTVPHTVSNNPQQDVKSSGWVSCDTSTIPNFSATAYFFARYLWNAKHIPIGLIHSSYGGTPVESWTSPKGLRRIPEFTVKVNAIDTTAVELEKARKLFAEKTVQWNSYLETRDLGYSNEGSKWYDSLMDYSDWYHMKLPVAWEEAGLPDFDGIVWFEKDIMIPLDWEGKDLSLHLGPVDDMDITYFNGTKVGGMNLWDQPRNYTIPGSLVKAGINKLVVRVLDTNGAGGIVGNPEDLFLTIKDSKENPISLAGEWNYKVSLNMKDLPAKPLDPENPYQVCSLYNGMIAPLVPFAIRGVIWYQGETNTGNPYLYRTTFPNMIHDWREHWNQGEFPFLFVQLASWKAYSPVPKEDNWAELREAQLMTLSLPSTGMAVAIDIGNAQDIHPKNKQEIGRRLGLVAQAKVYGDNLEYSGPIYQGKKIEKDKIRLSFSHIDGGLVTKDGQELKEFSISGEDQKFEWAQAKIDGDTIVVWNDHISKPVQVRYAWQANPICNLYNKAGLPASPFRTDEWPGVMQTK